LFKSLIQILYESVSGYGGELFFVMRLVVMK
jgi:hypothetical protein